jgi:hypothetical protein
LDALRGAKPENFTPNATVETIRAAIEVARRSLLPAFDHPVEKLQAIENLRNDLASSVVDALAKKHPGQTASSVPPEFWDFLAGKDPRFPGGILDQLCVFVALYLKNDSRAQIAVLHFTLQEFADSQARVETRIDELCQMIYRQNESQSAQLRAFEHQIADLAKTISLKIDKARNDFIRPPLEFPFASRPVDTLAFPFTYMARQVPLIGRDEAIEALMEFLGDPTPALWTVISGPAGTGKSRLAAELISKTADRSDDEIPPGYWRAGFLKKRSDWIKGDGRKWRPDTDTLLVIDYAGELSIEDLSAFLENLVRLRGLDDCIVRIILIDRMPPDSDLGLVTQLGRGDRHGNVLVTRWLHPSAAKVLAKDQRQPGERYSSRLTDARRFSRSASDDKRRSM